MRYLSFLADMDEEKRAEYLIELTQILDAEERANEWRFSQTAAPKTKYPVIRAKTGHITKLENEGIARRTYSSSNKTRYQLAVPQNELRWELSKYNS